VDGVYKLTELDRLVEDFVNFEMDAMSSVLKDEMLYEYMVGEHKNSGITKETLIEQIRQNYGDEWFEGKNYDDD
jgi:hypothetical protein